MEKWSWVGKEKSWLRVDIVQKDRTKKTHVKVKPVGSHSSFRKGEADSDSIHSKAFANSNVIRWEYLFGQETIKLFVILWSDPGPICNIKVPISRYVYFIPLYCHSKPNQAP